MSASTPSRSNPMRSAIAWSGVVLRRVVVESVEVLYIELHPRFDARERRAFEIWRVGNDERLRDVGIAFRNSHRFPSAPLAHAASIRSLAGNLLSPALPPASRGGPPEIRRVAFRTTRHRRNPPARR